MTSQRSQDFDTLFSSWGLSYSDWFNNNLTIIGSNSRFYFSTNLRLMLKRCTLCNYVHNLLLFTIKTLFHIVKKIISSNRLQNKTKEKERPKGNSIILYFHQKLLLSVLVIVDWSNRAKVGAELTYGFFYL